ncbi:MAG: type III pantothenate kinase [Planctomycetes bacterium]|nr:type III pantothenate kinase [Planctomycetota bacterium]
MLTVDVGNSSVGVGRVREAVVDVQRFREPEDAADQVLAWLAESGHPARTVAGRDVLPLPLTIAAAISVARPRLQRLQDALGAAGGSPLVVLREPPLALADARLAASAGSDRIANALALLPGPAVAVDAGTAVTVDLVDDSGTYRGGYIAPGPAAALLGLARSTAALPRLPGRPVSLGPGLHTDDAIAAGGWGLVVGGVDRLVLEARRALGVAARVVVTGAWGHAWMSASTLDGLVWDEHLVHRGIAVWAERARDAAR